LRKACALLLLIFLSSAAFAEGTRAWEQFRFDDLVKGTAKGIAIRSTGGLELAPSFKPVCTTPSTYIWSIAADDAGNVYAAAGSPARLYRITPDGKASIIFEPKELQVQALVVEKTGVIFAATTPDGKVYKIERRAASAAKPTASKDDATAPDKPEIKVDPSWSASIYFDPGTKYIWDLALDGAGNLYLATGDRGEIYRVTAQGEHSVFFKSDEAHIRSLALDAKGNLIAGSDGSGLVYRISPAGEAFVLYNAPKKEITALAVDAAGNIYAAGVGEKRPAVPQMPAPTPLSMPPPGGALAQPPGITITTSVSPISPMMGAFPAPGTGASGGSEVYRIAADGAPLRIWNSREDIVYALAFDQQGHLLAGTGNRGHIFTIVRDDDYTDLLKATAGQVTAFAKAPGGGLYASSSNLGKVFLLGPGPESQGTYESDVFDARIFSRWGRAEFRGTGNVDLWARSGNVDNPDRNWSPWKKVDVAQEAPMDVPPARFAQWKTVLRDGTPAPRVNSVLVNYLPKNVAPEVDDVSVQVGVRYQPLPKPAGGDLSLSTGGGGQPQPRFEPPVPAQRDRNSMGVKWGAHDENDDQLVYSVYYRGEGEARWLLLRDGLDDKFYSFDASLLPDGAYAMKVVASDAPSHSPGEALATEKESARFEVDATPPRIEVLTAAAEAGQIHVTFRAVDGFSPIKRAEYSVDAGDWQFVDPAGQLSDSKTENYDFRVDIPAGDMTAPAAIAGAVPSGTKAETTAPAKSKTRQSSTAAASAGPVEHVVVVRVYDRYDNLTSAKTAIRGK
jgi:hypothetical protein